jgi:hypothetical protein
MIGHGDCGTDYVEAKERAFKQLLFTYNQQVCDTLNLTCKYPESGSYKCMTAEPTKPSNN